MSKKKMSEDFIFINKVIRHEFKVEFNLNDEYTVEALNYGGSDVIKVAHNSIGHYNNPNFNHLPDFYKTYQVLKVGIDVKFSDEDLVIFNKIRNTNIFVAGYIDALLEHSIINQNTKEKAIMVLKHIKNNDYVKHLHLAKEINYYIRKMDE
jgi:hypothetical protein